MQSSTAFLMTPQSPPYNHHHRNQSLDSAASDLHSDLSDLEFLFPLGKPGYDSSSPQFTASKDGLLFTDALSASAPIIPKNALQSNQDQCMAYLELSPGELNPSSPLMMPLSQSPSHLVPEESFLLSSAASSHSPMMPNMDILSLNSPQQHPSQQLAVAGSPDWRSVVYPTDLAIESLYDVDVFQKHVKSQVYQSSPDLFMSSSDLNGVKEESLSLDPQLLSPFGSYTSSAAGMEYSSSFDSNASTNGFEGYYQQMAQNNGMGPQINVFDERGSSDMVTPSPSSLLGRRRSKSQSHHGSLSPLQGLAFKHSLTKSGVNPVSRGRRPRSSTISSPLSSSLSVMDSPDGGLAEMDSPQSLIPNIPQIPSTQVMTPSGKIKKTFYCHLCPSTFSRNHDLKRHIRIHLGIRPYKCATCPKAFTRADALHRHIHIRGCRGAEEEEGGPTLA